jgi:hypothetical protein
MPIIRLLLAAIALALCVQSIAQPATRRIRGDVVAIDGLKLTVMTRTRETVEIKLDEKYTVSAVVKTNLSAITPGSYVGTATLPQSDGGLRSLEVVVFPESGRGSGEGHYAWDLQPGSMMTNATVTQVAAAGQGRRITVKYKDGEKVIDIPPDAPIVTFEPGDRGMLRPGAHVIVGATPAPDGSLTASRISVGKDGLVPPM